MSPQPKVTFGWLLLGLGLGIVVGHAISFRFAVPPGYYFLYAERVTYILVGCGIAGLLAAMAFERQLQRLRIEYAMIVIAFGSLLYFVLLGLPLMNAARE